LKTVAITNLVITFVFQLLQSCSLHSSVVFSSFLSATLIFSLPPSQKNEFSKPSL